MVMVMKKKIITIIIIFLAIVIVALFFIPWYDNYYYLPGVNSETGEEVITRFDEWQSPFYALVIKGGNSIFFGVLFFIVLLIPLISITYGVGHLVKDFDRYMYVQILTFIISIIAFITIVFIMILFSPKY